MIPDSPEGPQAQDPVCGTTVDPSRAPAHHEHAGRSITSAAKDADRGSPPTPGSILPPPAPPKPPADPSPASPLPHQPVRTRPPVARATAQATSTRRKPLLPRSLTLERTRPGLAARLRSTLLLEPIAAPRSNLHTTRSRRTTSARCVPRFARAGPSPARTAGWRWSPRSFLLRSRARSTSVRCTLRSCAMRRALARSAAWRSSSGPSPAKPPPTPSSPR
jgi:hypothetical protein